MKGRKHSRQTISPPIVLFLLIFIGIGIFSYTPLFGISPLSNTADPAITLANKVLNTKNEMRFFSSVSRRADRDFEQFLALYKITEQIAMFKSIRVQTRMLMFESGSFDYADIAQIDFDLPAKELLDEITVIEMLQTSEGTYLLGRWDNYSGPLPDLSKIRTPNWIQEIPIREGYLFSVGTAQKSHREDYSFWEADQRAFGDLANSLNVAVYSGTIGVDENNESSLAEITDITSDQTLYGARIVARWRSSGKDTYYSLACMPID
jgi:hypothetical protein